MIKPIRSDKKYWTGTRDFDHIKYEQDLDKYIIELECQDPIHAVVNQADVPHGDALGVGLSKDDIELKAVEIIGRIVPGFAKYKNPNWKLIETRIVEALSKWVG